MLARLSTTLDEMFEFDEHFFHMMLPHFPAALPMCRNPTPT
jgi:uncharacterized protein (DUF305 family)